MGTFVLLAAFLLAVSATPIEHPSGPSSEDTAGTDAQNSPSSLPVDVSGTEAQQHSSDTYTGGTSGNGEQEEPSLPSSPDDGSASPQEGSASSGEQHSSDTYTGGTSGNGEQEEPSSPSSPDDGSASPQEGSASSGEQDGTPKVDNDYGQHNNGDTAITSFSTVSASTDGSSAGETTSTPVSSPSEGSTSPTTTKSGADVTNETAVNITDDSLPVSSNGTVTLPPDADPTDCRNGSQPNHIFTLCEFGCEGDEMEVAPPNATCYLPLNNTDTLIAMARTAGDNRKTGRCVEGKCVEATTAAWTAPQSNTSSSVW